MQNSYNFRPEPLSQNPHFDGVPDAHDAHTGAQQADDNIIDGNITGGGCYGLTP